MRRLNRLLVGTAILGLICMNIPAHARDISMSDKRFLKNAAEAGNFEIEGSKLALAKSKDADILRFARMMTDDHAQAALKLKDLATRRGVELPTEPSLVQQAKLKYLEMREGVKFDKSYATHIGVSAHEQAVKLFEDAAEDATDADIKKFAADTLPVLKKHLEEAKRIDIRVNQDD
ncbi:putative membrane protein [Methylophilus rhizosphaerae]|uniref:Putative membrane protein n=2 Tax=Methylophilus rhizosphaerae TaxID=492660 RepID=A0A1G9DYN4_9PROT|nr:putative membrane protein [Methylophilus rhizosphaerae]